MSTLCLFFLQYSTEFFYQPPTSYIFWIEGVFQVYIRCIFSSPGYQNFINLRCISFSLFILTNPNTNIELFRLENTQSSCTDKPICFLIQNKILEFLATRNLLF